MRITSIIMLLASIGFILMGIIILKSKKLRGFLINSYAYKDPDKFISMNGRSNIGIGIVGLILSGLDYLFTDKSKYIVIIFILVISVLSFIQGQMGKKYRIY